MKQKRTITCPYCGATAILRDASFIYGEKSQGGKVYVCGNYPQCDAYVGVHPGTRIPKGTLANPALRRKRVLAHQVFDQIWLRGIFSRSDAYHWMADRFCLSDSQAHIGQFGTYMCDQVIEESRKLLANQRPRLQAAL